MRYTTRRYLALLLALVLCLSLTPAYTYAEDVSEEAAETAESLVEEVVIDDEQVDIITTPEPETDKETEDETEAEFEDSEPSEFSAPSGTVYLAFTSDVHNKSSNGASDRLGNWLNGVSAAVGSSFAEMGICGDLADAHSNDTSYWRNAETVINTVRNSDKVIGDGFYVCGNHEWSPGKYDSTSSTVKDYYTANGGYTVTDNYVLYSMGASTDDLNRFSQTDMSSLAGFLNTAPTNIPIFILSHFPLHKYGTRDIENKDSVINTINQYASGREIVFLWGHNHTESDTYYDSIYTGTLDTKPISFTYASAGCMSDSEYSNGSAFVKGKGLVVKIVDGKISAVSYFDKDCQPFGGVTPSPSPAPTSGTCGKNLAWELENDGVLTVSGTGAMSDYQDPADVPWCLSRSKIKTVYISSDVTAIGDNAFFDCVNLRDVYYNDTQTRWDTITIGDNNDSLVDAIKHFLSVYTLSYDAKGGTGAPAPGTKTEGIACTISGVVPTREHYSFLGWDTASTAAKVVYEPGDMYTEDASITLYAVWKPMKYTVTVNAGEGGVAIGSGKYEYGTSITIAAVADKGYRFDRWTDADGCAVVDAGAAYTFTVADNVRFDAWFSRSGGTEAPQKLTIYPSPVPVLYNIGDILVLTVTADREEASTDVIWKSSRPDVASIDMDTGLVTVLGYGSTVITAISTVSAAKTASCTIKAIKPVTGIEVSAPAGQSAVLAGKSIQFKSVISGLYGTPGNKTVTWDYEPKRDGITLKNGRLALSKNVEYIGELKVTATAVGCNPVISDTFTIDVTAPIASFDILRDGQIVTGDRDNMIIKAGRREAVALETAINEGACRKVTWKSSNTKVATVEETAEGKANVTVFGKGLVSITATSCDGVRKSVRYTLNVDILPSEIDVTVKSYMAKASSVTPKATVLPTNVTNKKVVWEVVSGFDPAVMSFNSKTGKLTVSNDWTKDMSNAVTLKVTSQADTSVSTTFTVNIVEALAKSVKIYDSDTEKAVSVKTMAAGDTAGFYAEVLGTDLTEVTWTSSNVAVASVDDDGTVTALSEGKANVTVVTQDGNKTAKLLIIVKAPPHNTAAASAG